MKKIAFLLSITLIFLAKDLEACTCKSVGNFIKASQRADLTALIKIISHDDYFTMFPEYDSILRPMSVKVELVEVLKGKLEKKEIKIFGDNGYLCRESILHLKKDEYYVVSIHKAENRTWEYGIEETEEDFIISSCGEYLIKFDPTNQKVKGRIKSLARKEKVISYQRLKKLL